jgi:dihydrofolate reductase
MAFPSHAGHGTVPPAPSGTPRLALIVAVARNGVIGANNGLPWHLPEDLKRFRSLTTGHAIVMGRRTYQSIGRPLPDRQNLVVSRDPAFTADGVEVAGSLEQALAKVRLPLPAFCIGGAALFEAALRIADLAHVTEIDRDFEGDTFWTPLDPEVWIETSREQRRSERMGGVDYAYVTYRRAMR